MTHILLICTANICRSPVAEAILRRRLEERGREDIAVSSAGTWAIAERGAAYYSVKLMEERGFDLSGHISRMVEASHLDKADLVLCMEAGHVEALKTEFPTYSGKIHLLTEMAGANYSIPDPYGQSKEAYREMIIELTQTIDAGLERIISLAEENAAKRRT